MDTPPVAPKRPHEHSEHGVVRPDPWHWLRDREDAAVISYIEAENAWTEARLDPLEALRKSLFAEMLGRIQETDTTSPVPHGPWEYFVRTEEGRSYPLYCRRPRGGGPEQILLDVNGFAADNDYVSVRGLSMSPDHELMAYGIDTTGREVYEVRVIDLATGEIIDRVAEAVPGVTWTLDGRAFLWTELDPALRPCRVRHHRVGEGGEDPVVYTEDDPRFRAFSYRTRSQAFVVLGSVSSLSTELHLVPADQPLAESRCVQAREARHRYNIDHSGDTLWILSDDGGAVNSRLLRAPVTSTSKAEWVEVLPHREAVQVVHLDAFDGYLVLTERDAGQQRLRVRDLATGAEHHVEPPEPVCVIGVSDNREADTAVLRMHYGSMTTPYSTYDYDMASRELTLVRQVPVPGYDRSHYRTERRWAVADDGERVPVSIVRRADVTPGPDTPLVVMGYGSYGITIDPEFSADRVSLLDRGVVFAVAHIRGGGFMGRAWYESGKLEHKVNTFSDFAAAVRSLHADDLSSPARTLIIGGSAGGLLVGAVLNREPGLCAAAVAVVPFVDVVSTMLDASLPLTAGEWDEWGDPREPVAFERMLSYSPYDNVEPRAYPDLLVISGLNDPRVQFWEPTKWVARLRATATGGDVLLWTHMGAGHGGLSGRYGHLEDRAFEYAWVLDRLRAT